LTDDEAPQGPVEATGELPEPLGTGTVLTPSGVIAGTAYRPTIRVDGLVEDVDGHPLGVVSHAWTPAVIVACVSARWDP